jgi:hypothetical protein
MKTTWRTLWQQNDIVVYRDEVEVDRLPAERIERVYLVYRGHGDTPNDIAQTVVELAGDEGFAVFEPETALPAASISSASRSGRSAAASSGSRRRSHRCLAASPGRVARRSEQARLPPPRPRRAAGRIEGWQREGPQTWEDRKRRRIARSRPFGYTSGAHA